MGEFSDYFESFPEEDPANYKNGQFVDPRLAQAERDRQAHIAKEKLKEAELLKLWNSLKPPPPKA